MLKQKHKNYYQLLVERLSEINRLNGVMNILSWDQEVMMPVGAGAARAGQIETLAGVIHERITHPDMGECLSVLDDECVQFGAVERCNIREAQRQYSQMTKIPKRLVQVIAELSSRGQHIWIQARQENKFADFAPVLQTFLELKKEWAGYAQPNLSPYDANIDLFERGTKAVDIAAVFSQLKPVLVPLIQQIVEHPVQPDTSLLQGHFPVDKQIQLACKVSQDIGFQFDKGRMDVSVHPFCGGSHPTDVRITTRYAEHDFVESLYAVIHETGHALYEQGRMTEFADLPASEASTMGIHESQSLFWERMIAQNHAFCSYYFELIRKTFSGGLQDATVDAFYRAINACKPDYIRVEADELSYPLHVILRFEIEMGLFDGSIAVNDLPDVWNEKMMTYLGIKPPNDTLGVLQDAHWSGGAFGYFPSYTLGALYACQFFMAVQRDLPNVEQLIAAGDFSPIKNWLNEKIHSQGRLYTPQELVVRVTGEPLNVNYYIDYLKTKYGEIYQLSN